MMSGDSQTAACLSLSPELKTDWETMRARSEIVKSQRSRFTGCERKA